MTYAETTETAGVTGAKRTSWSKDNARSLFQKVRREHPQAKVKDIGLWMRDEASEDQIIEVFHYFAANAMQAEQRSPPVRATRKQDSPKKRAAKQKAQAKAVEAIKRTVAKVILLDLPMPNGKKLRDCTGGECLGFKGVFDAVVAIGRKIKPDEIVGEVLTETEVRKLYKEGK